MTDLVKAKKVGNWPKTRKEIEGLVGALLGSLPEERAEAQMKMDDEMHFRGYTRQRISYFVSDWERIAAWLFIPEGVEDAPAVLCCHDAVTQGKDEAAGLEGHPLLGFAQHFAELGYVTLAADCIATGDRVSRDRAPFDTRASIKDYPDMSPLLKMVSDHMFALGVLSELKSVDASRVGVIGHGLGGCNALLLSAYDERVQACVASCPFMRFEDDEDVDKRWDCETEYHLLPSFAEVMKSKKTYPFDWEHILALVAPSPSLLINSSRPSDGSDPVSTEKAVAMAKNIYKLLAAPSALECLVHEGEHGMDLESLDAADDWLARWL